MRRKITTLFAAILMALAMAAPAAAHPNTINGQFVGGPLDKAQGHFLGLECAAQKEKTPMASVAFLVGDCFLND